MEEGSSILLAGIFPWPTGWMLQGSMGETLCKNQVEVRGEDRNAIHRKGDTNYKLEM